MSVEDFIATKEESVSAYVRHEVTPHPTRRWAVRCDTCRGFKDYFTTEDEAGLMADRHNHAKHAYERQATVALPLVLTAVAATVVDEGSPLDKRRREP